MSLNRSRCFVSTSWRPSGVDNLIVVETTDAVHVAHRDNAQEVKEIVVRLIVANRRESTMHLRMVSTWDSYEGVDEGERLQAKRIGVNPGGRLSLQMHDHRA